VGRIFFFGVYREEGGGMDIVNGAQLYVGRYS